MPVPSLVGARDRSPHSSRNTSKGALIEEIFGIFSAVRRGLAPGDIRKAALEGQILRKSSFETRRKIMDALGHRYCWPHSDWSVRALAAATEAGVQSPTFVSLAYLYYALRDRLTHDFIVGPIWDRWASRSTAVAPADLLGFIGDLAEKEPHVKKWRESTRIRLARQILAALRDFGLLRGIQRKQIRKPVVAPETVFHLLCVLLAEGAEGRDLVKARDWRLFLWSESEVAQALGELSQRRWVRFEKSGGSVMLELLRQPGEDA